MFISASFKKKLFSHSNAISCIGIYSVDFTLALGGQITGKNLFFILIIDFSLINKKTYHQIFIFYKGN